MFINFSFEHTFLFAIHVNHIYFAHKSNHIKNPSESLDSLSTSHIKKTYTNESQLPAVSVPIETFSIMQSSESIASNNYHFARYRAQQLQKFNDIKYFKISHNSNLTN